MPRGSTKEDSLPFSTLISVLCPFTILLPQGVRRTLPTVQLLCPRKCPDISRDPFLPSKTAPTPVFPLFLLLSFLSANPIPRNRCYRFSPVYFSNCLWYIVSLPLLAHSRLKGTCAKGMPHFLERNKSRFHPQ